VLGLALAILVAFALLDVDAATSSSDHLRGALHGGVQGFVDVAVHRVPLSYARVVEQWWLVFPAAGAIVVGVLSVRLSRRRGDAAPVVALLVALGTSLLVNDSPGAVAIAGLAALLALEGGLLHRVLVQPVAERLRLPLPSAPALPASEAATPPA
jgi:hypothetical protein